MKKPLFNKEQSKDLTPFFADADDINIIHSLFDALVNRDCFQQFLSRLIEINNACAAELVVIKKHPLQIEQLWYAGLPEDFMQWYLQNNMIEQDLVSRYATYQTPGLFHSALSIMDKLDITEDYQRWQEDQNMLDSAWLVVASSDSHSTLLVMQRTVQQGEFKPHELVRLNYLVPFVRQAVHLYQQVDYQEIVNNTLVNVVNAIPQATLILNEMALIVHANEAAQETLSAEPLISIQDQHLAFKKPEIQEQFLQSMIQVVRASMGQSIYDSDALFIHRHNKSPIVMLIRPIKEADLLKGGALITLLEAGSRTFPNALGIGKYFSLTTSEAELCADLILGLSLSEIASKQNKAESTLRSYLKSIFLKTNFKRQSALVSGILSALLY
ncbi:helix-turn-helix transcriptional regulator [Marinomonas dokdonensis]|uniref:helix-turn-helix transcriptional regulator n=1 Tax=Marinomonas dokdonensis TaxID=328224 RepID=UPI00405582B9